MNRGEKLGHQKKDPFLLWYLDGDHQRYIVVSGKSS